LRIVGGKYKGRQIQVVKNFKARPTTDFAKENLFNFLSNYFDFEETAALDLFAGTGSISYELASRGCPEIDLVETDHRSCSFIKKVISDIGMHEIHVFRADAFHFIEKAKKQYDLIFADPPYQNEKVSLLPGLIFTNSLLKPKGWFILEHSAAYNFTGSENFREKRTYGNVNFSVFAI
jgi:16S rRNA (guanine966-N2)-methyltransferase